MATTTDTLKLEIKVQDDGSVIIKNFKQVVEGSLESISDKAEKSGTLAEKLWVKIGLGNIAANVVTKAANTIKNALEGSAKEFMVAEAIHEDMIATMRGLGIATSENIQQFERLAKQIQKQTVVDDEAAKSLITLALTMGVEKDKIGGIVEGVIGLSKAYKIDYESALRGIVQAQNGHFELLSRSIPTLRSAKTEYEKMTIVQNEMAAGFQRAKAEIQTSSGQWAQFKNQIADFQEVLGGVLVKGIKLVIELKEAIIVLLAAIAVDRASKLKIFDDMLTYFRVLKAEGASTGAAIVGSFKEIGNLKGIISKIPTSIVITAAVIGAIEAGKTLEKLADQISAAYDKEMNVIQDTTELEKRGFEKYRTFTREMLASGKLKQQELLELSAKYNDNYDKAEKYNRVTMEILKLHPELRAEWQKTSQSAKFYGEHLDIVKKKEEDTAKAQQAARQAASEADEKAKARAKELMEQQRKQREAFLEGIKDELAAYAEREDAVKDFYKDLDTLSGKYLDERAASEEAAEAERKRNEQIQHDMEDTAKALGVPVEYLWSLKKKTDESSEATKKWTINWKDANEVMQFAKSCIGEIGNLLEALGIDLDDTGQQLLKFAGDAATLAAGIASHNPAAIISGAVAVLGDLINIFSGDGIGEAIDRENEWMGLTEQQIENLKKLAEETGNTHEATSEMLDEFIREGDITTKNFDHWAGRMHEILSDVDAGTMTGAKAAKEIGDAWSALIEKMKDLHLPGASREMIATIQDLRARGIEVKEITEYVQAETAKGIEALGGYFKLAADSSERFGHAQEAMAAMFARVVKTEGLMAAIGEFGDVLDQLIGISKEKGYEINSLLQEAVDMRSLIQGNESIRAVNEEIGYTTQILESLGNTGDLTFKLFQNAMEDVNSQYDRLIAGGATSEQALNMTAQELAKLWWYSKQYGYSLDSSTQSLVDQGIASGAINSMMIPAQEKMVSLLESIAEALGAKIPYALDEMGKSAESNIGKACNEIIGLGYEIDGALRPRTFEVRGVYDIGLPEIPGEEAAASGWEGIVPARSYTRFVTGEREAEHIKITPLSEMVESSSNGRSGGVNKWEVYLNGVLTPENVADAFINAYRGNKRGLRTVLQ